MYICHLKKISHIYNIYLNYIWTSNAYIKNTYNQTFLYFLNLGDEIMWIVTPWPTFETNKPKKSQIQFVKGIQKILLVICQQSLNFFSAFNSVSV